MLQQLEYTNPTFYNELRELVRRDVDVDMAIEDTVRSIIRDVRLRGDQAVLEFTSRFDQFEPSSEFDLELSAETIESCYQRLPVELQNTLTAAANRIKQFHEREMIQPWSYVEDDGTQLGQLVNPIDTVGVYVPGGKAAYPSSVLMTTIPAKVAGVNEIIMSVPTPRGELNDAVVAAAKIAGVDRIFTMGGAQAVAAMAYGTEVIPKVDKIVGPGNAYVATAKKMVFGDVGIDMIAGPSEVVVICDDSADPDWVAMDLFAQAEHDELAQSIAITTSPQMRDKVIASIDRLIKTMQRQEIINQSLSNHGGIVLVENLSQAAEVANFIAPEHLELMLENPEEIMGEIKHAGAIFVGKFSAEALGDYCAGPNHVLPTSGTARFSSPLGVYDFQKRTSVINASPEGADQMAKIATVLAASEGLTAHEQSARYRLKS